MAKKLTDLISPDLNAIIALRKHHGWTGYGIYCALIHLLETQPDSSLDADYGLLSYHLREEEELIESVIEDFDLFAFEETEGVRRFFIPEIRNERLRKAEISKKRAEAAAKRWQTNASVSRPRNTTAPHTSTTAPHTSTAAPHTSTVAPHPSAPVPSPEVCLPSEPSDAQSATSSPQEGGFDLLRNPNEFKKHPEWVKFLAEQHRCSYAVLTMLYGLFLNHLKSTGGGRYKTVKDAQAHFANWLKKEYARVKKAELTRLEEKRKEDEEYERNRAISVTHDEYLASRTLSPESRKPSATPESNVA